MDHPFQTNRKTLECADSGVALCTDILELCRMTEKQRRLVRSRCEGLIEDEDIRDTLERHSYDLGRLLDKLADAASITGDKISDTEARVWREYLQDNSIQMIELRAHIETLRSALQEKASELRTYELQDEYSSLSDYSDSDTTTSDSDMEEEDDDE